MVRQYLEERPDGLMDSYAMSAGEHAIEALADFGDMEKVAVGRIFAALGSKNVQAPEVDGRHSGSAAEHGRGEISAVCVSS